MPAGEDGSTPCRFMIMIEDSGGLRVMELQDGGLSVVVLVVDVWGSQMPIRGSQNVIGGSQNAS